MKWHVATALAVMVAFVTGNSTKANEIQQAAYNSNCCENVCDLSCDSKCGNSGPYAQFDLLFLRYHRADGMRFGSAAGETGEFDYETSPRITLGYVGDSGLGARVRYWEYEHFQQFVVGPDGVSADAYNLDLELFERFDLNCDWDVELSGGFRYADHVEALIDPDEGAGDLRINAFDGLGLIFGIEGRRQIRLGSLFARTRMAVVQGDKFVRNIDNGLDAQPPQTLLDTTHAMLEIAIGHEVSLATNNGAEFFGRYGLEWWQFDNMSSAFNPIGAEDQFQGASDVGYAGFMFSFGVRR